MRRRGFTILELVLVMTIMVIVGALAFPSFEAMLTSSNEVAARDMVRASWAEIRARALEENRPYRFAVVSGAECLILQVLATAVASSGKMVKI